jgi:hypothetical protein
MLDPQFFISGIQTPTTHPSSPAVTRPPSPSSPSSLDEQQASPQQLLMELQILAFAESGIGSELDAL